MIRIERSPAFWSWVAEDESVAANCLHGFSARDLCEFVQRADVRPYAADHGGFLFQNMDGYGRLFELHTMFRREGWGREATLAARQVFSTLFRDGAQIVVTQEQSGQWRSAPPRSHGWKKASDDFVDSPIGPVRHWILTIAQWNSAPAFKDHA